MLELLKDKSVAIVGPAQYMQNSCLGHEIDGHDVVVRINRSIETTKTHENDIGKRTDILYSCLIEKFANAGRLNVKDLEAYGVKFICAPPKSEMNGISYSTVLHDMVDIKNVQKISQTIPIRIVDHKFHTKLAQLVNCRPNTGFLAIYDLLRFELGSLSVYGFSFYLDGFIEGCKSGIEEEIGMTDEQFTKKCFVSKRHVQKNMWLYAKSTLLENPTIHLDNTLEKILKMNDLNKEEWKKCQ